MLTGLLKDMRWLAEGTDMYDYYLADMREFGEVRTDMGIIHRGGSSL